MHFKRFLFLFVALSFAMYCASFSVFAEEITATFDFSGAVLERLIILNSFGEVINTEDRGVVGTEYTDNSYVFTGALSGAYYPSIPGDIVCGQVRYTGQFSDAMAPGYTYDYVKVSYSFDCTLSTGFDDISNDAFQTNVYLDLLDGSEFRRFDEYTITVRDQSWYTISFYGEIPDNNTFDYLRCTIADISFPLSYTDFASLGQSPDLYLDDNSISLTYIESVDSGGGDSGGGDTGGGDSGGGDSGGGSDSSDIVIIVSRLDSIETILQDIGTTADSIESKIVIQNQLISDLPGNIADEIADKDLGVVPPADLHEDIINIYDELEDNFLQNLEPLRPSLEDSIQDVNSVLDSSSDFVGGASDLFLDRVFDIPFIRNLVILSLGFGFIGYVLRIGGKVI